MVSRYLVAAGVILGIALCWVGVQYAYRRFAWRHPEFGPIREIFGCGMACTCSEPCEAKKKKDERRTPDSGNGFLRTKNNGEGVS